MRLNDFKWLQPSFFALLFCLGCLFSAQSEATLFLKPYGVNTELDGKIYGYPHQQVYPAQLVEKDGRLWAQFSHPVTMVSRDTGTKKVVKEIELDPGPHHTYKDILLFLNSLGEKDLILFPKENQDPAVEPSPSSALVTQAERKWMNGTFRRHTYILVDVYLENIEAGVLTKPNLRPAFEQVFGSQMETSFFGITSGMYQNGMAGLTETLPSISVVHLDEPGVKEFLSTALRDMIERELASPWSSGLRRKLIDAQAAGGLCTQFLGGGNGGTHLLMAPKKPSP